MSIRLEKIIQGLLGEGENAEPEYMALVHAPERRRDPESRLKCPKCPFEHRSAGTLTTHLTVDHEMNPKDAINYVDKLVGK